MSEEMQLKSSDIEESVRKAVGKKPARWGLESPDELIGSRIDERYTIVERIARGGMGAVFKAIQAPMGRVCAVKVLSATYEGKRDPAFDKRFFREAATISRLRHPNTVTLYDYGNIGDLYYMAMEYVGGRTLHAEIYREGRFGESRARQVAMQICRSLREAHSHGVIHRDLKPDNVLLVDRASEKDLVKVLDFGLAKVIEGDLADEDVTETGLCMGSPKHMAPEQIIGDTVSAHTDIYALGILMYEMLTAHSPFDRPTRYQTLVAQVHEPPMPFGRLLPDAHISEDMQHIVMRCLNKERHRRFPSMNDVLQALKSVERAARGSMASVPSAVSTIVPQLAEPEAFPPSIPEALPGTAGSQPAAPPSLYPPPSHPSLPDPPAEPDAPSLRDVPRIPPLAPFKTEEPKRFPVALVAGIVVGVLGTGSAVAAALYHPVERPVQAATILSGVSSAIAIPAKPVPLARPESRVVRVESVPSGARVRRGEQTLCETTPCEIRLDETLVGGKLTFVMAGYASADYALASIDRSVKVELAPLGRASAKKEPPPSEELAEDTGYKYSPY